MDKKLCFVEYNQIFLNLSWDWLNDKEVKKMTMTPNFTKEDSYVFFNSLSGRKDYFIVGIEVDNIKIGACGLKNIKNNKAEYWGYIGDKKYWGNGFGSEIIKSIIEIARNKKITLIYLKVISSNKRAINLYYKNDFIIVGKTNGILTMERKI